MQELETKSLDSNDIEVLDALEEETEEIPFEYSITSYGADYPVDTLIKRLDQDVIVIPPFQRSYVWTLKQASRFIESLLIGLPVPGIFLSKERDSQKLLVIDGQQRLRSLQDFYHGVFSPTQRAFALSTGQKSRYNSKTYTTLNDEDRRRLDDAILHATIVKQDEPSDEDSSIYNIFERLNTGGTLLQPQEIRVSIYQGPFQKLLDELNKYNNWRVLYGPTNKNRRDEELILRFFALYYNADKYEGSIKGFLNDFMRNNRNLKQISADELSHIFKQTIDVILECLTNKAFKPQGALNAAVFDSIMVGVARRLAKKNITDCATAFRQYKELVDKAEYSAATGRATGNSESVKERLTLATKAFAEVA